MPSPEAILASLKLAANDSLAVAVLWHVAAVALIVAIVVGWRPSRRLAGVLLSTPVASAAIVAFAHGNAFNGSLLGALTVVLAATAWRFDRSPVRRSSIPLAIVGAAMLGFGLFYPHFLGGSPAKYLVAAPAGLIPCPTLSLVIGFTLISGGFGSRGWSLPLSVVGLFYGLFGMFRLDVMLDVGLVAGAGLLLAVTVRSGTRVAPSIVANDATHFTKA
jgi:hypothetical protein